MKTKIILGLACLLVLSAFGCKQTETAQEETTEQAESGTPQGVTYNTNENTTAESKTTEAAPTETPAATETAASTAASDQVLSGIIIDQAAKLAEIHGTYSNKDTTAYKNLKDLKQYSTEAFAKKLDAIMAVPNSPNAQYYGVVTKAISQGTIHSSDTDLHILVTVKREETISTNPNPKISYKILLVAFAKVKDNWKLNSLAWQ